MTIIRAIAAIAARKGTLTMGKKYNTVAPIAAYNFNLEPMFEVTAYEGIKPSRAKAIVRHNAAMAAAEAEMRAERVSNHKSSTDKQGKRPVTPQDRERSQDVVLWKHVGSVDTHGERISLFESDAGYRIERTPDDKYGVRVEAFSSIEEVEYQVKQFEYGCMDRCRAVINLFERLMHSHSFDIECECTLCISSRDAYRREFERELERAYRSTNGTGHSWMYYGWGCPTCRK